MGDLYPKIIQPLSNTNLYVPNPNAVRSIDLRAQLHSLLFGDRAHPGQGRKLIIRSMTAVCPCVEEENGQKHREPDPNCSICQGEGYTFKDSIFTGWKSIIDSHSGAIVGTFVEQMPGLTNIMGHNFIFEWNVPIRPIDKIIEFDLDIEGNPPVGKTAAQDAVLSYQYKKFKIIQVIPYRGDHGRVEYMRVIGEREEF